jgi:uncharacterized SAM-binding protein YcdF (DUF218 family)
MQQAERAAGLPRHLGTCCSFDVDHSERPQTAGPESEPLDALVVLGCRVRAGRPSGTLESRLELVRKLTEADQPGADESRPPIVVSGGRRWDGDREAEVMADWLEARGVPRSRIILEAESMTTGQNARKVARLLAHRGWHRVGLVTSDFHMARALRLFRREGIVARPCPARTELGYFTKVRLTLREIGALLLGHFEPR